MARNQPEVPEEKNEQPSIAEQVRSRKASPEISREKTVVNVRDLYPSGSTLLNLACSDSHRGAFKLGTIVTLPGSSSSGKSMLAETALACGVYDPRFRDYALIRDDAEAAYSFDTCYLFGEGAGERIIEPPNGCSNTIQQFTANILSLTKKEKPVVYVLDSLDSLSSDEELEKEMRKALAMAKSEEAAKKIAGSYGTEKAKILGQTLRMINQELERTRSLLFIVQQIRQKLNAMPFGSPWTTSGGEAPFFYSSHQVWLNKTGSIKAKDRKIGTRVKAEVKKNKLNGKLRDCEFDIFYDLGVDNIGSMVDWMLKEKFWERKGGTVYAEGLGLEGTRPSTTGATGTLVEQIEEQNLEGALSKLVAECWREIEDSLMLNRKPRFG